MTNHAYTTIFFDWGGVIANDPGDDFLKSLLASLGATDAQVQEIMDTYMKDFMCGHLSEANFWHLMRGNYGLAIHDTIADEFQKWQGLVANQDILGLVDEARQHGLHVGLLSNVIEPTYNVLQRAGYYDLFDEVIVSCKVGYAKPDQQIYQIALDRFGVTAGESVFVDDKQKCLAPAREMGFHTILAQHPAQIMRDVRACYI